MRRAKPMSSLPQPKVLVVLSHARLRDAIAAELATSACVSVTGTFDDLDCAVLQARTDRADAVVVGTGLLRGDLVASVRKLIASLPGTRIVIVGTETSASYARALEAAGAAAYVSLQWGADVLSTSVRLATRPDID